jgi:hypothetical protein
LKFGKVTFGKISAAEWILRLGTFGIFFGHGLFALIKGPVWLHYLQVIGFSEQISLTLLPLIGVMDLIVALWVLIWPIRIVVLLATFLGLITSILRILAGEGIIEFIVRIGNWVVPLALLEMHGWARSYKAWFRIKD